MQAPKRVQVISRCFSACMPCSSEKVLRVKVSLVTFIRHNCIQQVNAETVFRALSWQASNASTSFCHKWKFTCHVEFPSAVIPIRSALPLFFISSINPFICILVIIIISIGTCSTESNFLFGCSIPLWHSRRSNKKSPEGKTVIIVYIDVLICYIDVDIDMLIYQYIEIYWCTEVNVYIVYTDGMPVWLPVVSDIV